MYIYHLIRVVNIIAKREIAHYEQLFFLPQCFQKLSAAKACACGKGLVLYNIGKASNRHVIDGSSNDS